MNRFLNVEIVLDAVMILLSLAFTRAATKKIHEESLMLSHVHT